MRVLYFGIYSRNSEYPRNNNIIRGLRQNGVEVIECNHKLAAGYRQRLGVAMNPLMAVGFLSCLLFSYFVLTCKLIKAPRVQAIVVGHPGYFHVHLARLLRDLFRPETLLVYDIFIPLYDTMVDDRRLYSPKGMRARLLHCFEASCCRSADLCLLDTQANCDYIAEEYGLAAGRLKRVLVGSTISHMKGNDRDRPKTSFKVLYFGTYIPLHGVDVILKAADLLRRQADIRFLMIGTGQLRKPMEAFSNELNLDNIIFLDWVPTYLLGKTIRSCDVVLGVFGDTAKAMRVIPSKVFDACAIGAPLITAQTKGIREAFTHLQNAYLVPPNDPHALAAAVMQLKSDTRLRRQIASPFVPGGLSM